MSATLILLSAISLGCGRPGQAEVVAQGGAGVFGAGDTALFAGSAPRGTPKGYQLRGHHWPERRVTDPAERRMPELFIASELLATGGRAVLKVMLHEGSHALAVVRGLKR